MEQMFQMLQNVSQSMEAQKLRIDEYNAETKRISAVSAGMDPAQVQEVVMQTLRDVMTAGDEQAQQAEAQRMMEMQQLQQAQQMQQPPMEAPMVDPMAQQAMPPEQGGL
jgi:uncharacterized protein (DUF2267 family)